MLVNVRKTATTNAPRHSLENLSHHQLSKRYAVTQWPHRTQHNVMLFSKTSVQKPKSTIITTYVRRHSAHETIQESAISDLWTSSPRVTPSLECVPRHIQQRHEPLHHDPNILPLSASVPLWPANNSIVYINRLQLTYFFYPAYCSISWCITGPPSLLRQIR